MVQRYTEIPSTQKIRDSLQPILNNDKTALSCSAGTSFPSANVVEGMLCYRTDEKKLYQLIDVNNPKTGWVLIADLNGEFRHIEGGEGNAIDYTAKDLNLWNKMPTGFYEGTNMLNAPEGDTQWRVIQFRHGNSDGFATQIAFGFTSGLMMIRHQAGGDWSDWNRVFAGSPTGAVIEGMNAEKVGGYKSGNESGQVPVSNGTVNTNLNADMVDGYHAGNAANQVPVSNGTVNAGLNADQLDGYHAGNGANQIPLNNGVLNKGLNAEKIGGFSATEFVKIAGDGKVNVINANSTTSQSATIQGVDSLNYNVFVTPRQTTTRDHLLSGVSSDTYDYYNNAGGSGDYAGTRTRIYVKTVPELGGNGNYSINTILKALVKVAHSHSIVKEDYRYNCRCDCNCDCDCSDDNCSE